MPFRFGKNGRYGFVVLFLLLVAMFGASPTVAAQADTPALFRATRQPQQPAPLELGEIRSRYVEIDFAALSGQATATKVPTQFSQQLTLNLFAGERFTAVLDRIEKNRSGSQSWIGHLQNIPDSDVILVSHQGLMQGIIVHPGGIYRLKYLRGATHQIIELDQAAFIDHDEEIPVPRLPRTLSVQVAPAVSADDGTVIDMLFVYTTEMKNAAGGTAAAEALIDLAVAETNQSYSNSNVNQRIYPVHVEETTYTETGSSSTELVRFAGTSDGYMDSIHTSRDTYHADFAQLVTDGDGCGLGYLQTSSSAAFQSSAFSQARDSCLVGNYTAAHELGHNMGLRHDWYVDDSTTPATYAHGMTNYADGWRTVMAYNDRCAVAGGSCTRLMYFSNPNLSREGDPMGVPSGTATNCVESSTSPEPQSCDADSHTVLNDGAAVNAQFRRSEIVWLGHSSDWTAASNWAIQEGPYYALTTVNRVPRAIDDILIPTAPTGGNFPTISSGTLNARNVTIQTGAMLTMSGGTLNVHGNWTEEGTGSFAGAGGTVIFQDSYLAQTITANGAFYHLQIGNGASTAVSLLSNLNIDGDFTLSSNATFAAGSHAISAAGNWTDQTVGGFDAGTGTVVFDGTATQTVDKTVTSSTLLDEDFSAYDSSCCTSALPSGWSRDGTWYQGDLLVGGDGSANRWRNETDGYLISPPLTLAANTTYTLNYNVGTRRNYTDGDGTLSPQTVTVLLGTGSDVSSLTTVLSGPTAESGAFFQARVINSITVSTSGTYYLAFRGQQSGDDYTVFDDVVLTGVGGLVFHNLTVDGAEVVFSDGLTVTGNLVVNGGKTADFGAFDPSVDGSVSNSGSLKQSKDVPSGGTTSFLEIFDSTGSTGKYYGTRITPTAAGLGTTSVTISGSQNCTSNGADPLLTRCYDISPTNANSATIRYYYSSGELNSQTWNSLELWDWHNSAWTELAAGNDSYGSGCGTAAGCWGEWTGVDTFSPMVLGSAEPTGSPAGTCAAPTAPTTLTLNQAGTQLSWSGGTADSYEAWRSTNDAYFDTGSSCTSTADLTCAAATSPHTVSSGSVGSNYYYKVVAVNSCGSRTPTATPVHVGEFHFGLTPGTP